MNKQHAYNFAMWQSRLASNKRMLRVTGLLAGFLFLSIAATADEKKPKTHPPGEETLSLSNPHWTKDGCMVCHEESMAGKVASENHETNVFCLSCHNGRLAPSEPHPIHRLFNRADLKRPDGWPLVDNELACKTCHDVTRGWSQIPTRPSSNPMFLRDFEDGHKAAFCLKCHTPGTGSGKHNPHLIVQPDGSIANDGCLFCHDETMTFDKRNQKFRTGESHLVGAELILCIGCHTQHIDYFDPGHIGVVASEKILNNLAQTRLGDREALTVLPLGEGNVVRCTTCHNPHQKGVFEDGSLLGLGGLRFEPNRRELALRGAGDRICETCHLPQSEAKDEQ